MDAINGVNLDLSVKFGDMNYDTTKPLSQTETPAAQEPNSFLSILNMLDVNADGKIDPEELKFGAGFMINNLINNLDQDGDQLLSAQEAGVSPGVISQLDTDSDQKVSAKEMITAADKIIDGLVNLLDTDGDKALSQDELGLFELLFNGQTSANTGTGSNMNTNLGNSLTSTTGEQLGLDKASSVIA